MKLYTEKALRQSLMKHQNASMFLSIEQIDYLIEEITPIELPSDEEIEKANPFVFGSHVFGTRDLLIWEQGAKWMRDKIGGNK